MEDIHLDEQDIVKNEHLAIEQSIKSCERIMDDLLTTNAIQTALESIEPFVERSVYHSFSKALLLIAICLCTYDKSDIERAAKAVEELNQTCNKYRKTGFVVSLMKIIKTPNYQKYTDIESHAQLIHAYSIAMSAAVYALTTYNVYGLIRIVYRMQKFLKNFNQCKQLFRMKTEWESDYSQKSFEAGIRLANGLAHLAISTIPPKILRVVNFLGYKGVESKGWSEINRSAFDLPGFQHKLARLCLIAYWSYAEPHGCIEANHLDDLKEILDIELEKHPESILFCGLKAKYEQLCGRIDISIHILKQLMNRTPESVAHSLRLEMMFCYALKCQWDECIKCAQILREQTKHSPACATYAEAVFRYIRSQELSDEDMKETANKLFAAVPTLRVRHFGKTMTPEKVAVVNSEKYFSNDHFLILPEMEFLYQINYLSFIKGDKIMLNKFMVRVDQQIEKFKDDIVGSDYLDYYLTALFYKGVIHRLMGQLDEAKQCFNKVLEDDSRIGREFSISPKTIVELGLIAIEEHDYEGAQKYLNRSINDYSGYLFENYVHIKAYGALRQMGISIDQQNADESKLELYKKQWLKDIDVEHKNYQEIVQNEEQVITK